MKQSAEKKGRLKSYTKYDGVKREAKGEVRRIVILMNVVPAQKKSNKK